MSKELCPCHSGNQYSACCQPYHNGKLAENAQVLMRSRYSAYAKWLAHYIIQTTHPDHLEKAQKPRPIWEKEIRAFCEQTSFDGLEIVDFQKKGNDAHVTFQATLSSHGNDMSFIEVSAFEKVDGHWLYKSGVTRR